MKDVLYRIGVGMRLVRASVGVWGTPALWDTIGWWHTEVHYTIPRIREEKLVAAELELAFGQTRYFGTMGSGGVTNYVRTMGSVGVIGSPSYGSTSTTSITPHISFGDGKLTFKDQRVLIDPYKSSVGQWQWESVGIRTEGVPTPLRRLLIRVLVGAEWVGDEGTKKPRPSLGGEYDRLSEFLSH
jgi:hypothetical protein